MVLFSRGLYVVPTIVIFEFLLIISITIYAAEKRVEKERFTNLLTRDDQKNEVFKIAKQMTKTNQDIIGEKCVRDDTGELAFDDKSKKASMEKLL